MLSMTVIELVDVVSVFHCSVRHENTGDPDEFSAKLGISRSAFFNMISELRLIGIDIRYSRKRQTYYYSNPDDVEISLTIRQK